MKNANIRYLTVSQIARLWQLSERSVRNYCASGRVIGAKLDGKTWRIPKLAVKPSRMPRYFGRSFAPRKLLDLLREEKSRGARGGIYHKVQIDLTYNSNRIEGSTLSKDETLYIFDTNTIGALKNQSINTDDIVETANHFRCIDMIIKNATRGLSEFFIKQLHRTLKNGTSDSRKEWINVGEYKKLPNEVGGIETTPPEEVQSAMKALLASYKTRQDIELADLLDFHYNFEKIHPFQDGNGRVGRLILFKECLRNGIVPFIIDDSFKLFYYRGLKKWHREKGYLLDTCQAAQDLFKTHLDYFKIDY